MPALSSATEDPASYPTDEGDGGDSGGGQGDEGGDGKVTHVVDGPSDEELISVWFPRFMQHSSTMIHNATEHDEDKMFYCFKQYVHSELHPQFGPDACPVKFDGVSCWPQTPPGVVRYIPCFDVFNGVYYDASENNASLYCYPNGTWSSRSFYNHCLNAVTNTSVDHGSTLSTTKTIFYIGNSLSLIAVTLALWIFISFKDLRCLRNTIHTNLLFTYLLHNLCWIVYASVQALVGVSVGCFFFITLNYFIFTNFMWMFVEGFYLYMLVVKTFSVEKIKLRVYTLIGWGVPVPIILLWVLVKSQVELQQQTGGELDDAEMVGTELEGLMKTCPLMPATPIDWMHKIPVLVVLSLNMVFLTRIMWVLITKLRSANTVETQRYRKATKALLVLIPLLGLTYMLMIVLPQELEHVRAVLLSTQGFWVALFFCFLNSEVQNSIRHHIERWKTARGLTDPRHPSVRQRDESPRPHKTDLCSSYGRRLFGSKRESLCSEVTTMTTFVANGYNPVSTQTNTLPLPTSQSQPVVGSLAFRNSTAGLPQCSAGGGGGGGSQVGGNSVGGDDIKSSVKDSLL